MEQHNWLSNSNLNTKTIEIKKLFLLFLHTQTIVDNIMYYFNPVTPTKIDFLQKASHEFRFYSEIASRITHWVTRLGLKGLKVSQRFELTTLCTYDNHNNYYIIIHQSGVCLPSLKKRLRPSLSCRFLEYAGNERNLIG